MIVLVLFGLWIGREHLRDVLRKAFQGDNRIDDRGEMLSYRAAVLTWLSGVTIMTIWLWQSGLPLWAAFLTLMLAILIFVGLTRVVVEGGVAAAVGPMISPTVLVSAVGSSAIGPAGIVGLAYTFVWAADIRTFVMASCAHGLKLGEELGARLRPLFLVHAAGDFCQHCPARSQRFLHLAYEYGGINLNPWFLVVELALLLIILPPS